jgi:hypothetical protein
LEYIIKTKVGEKRRLRDYMGKTFKESLTKNTNYTFRMEDK